MSFRIQDEKAVKDAYQDVRNSSTNTEWCLCTYEGKEIILADTGVDYQLLLEHFKDDERCFAYVRRRNHTEFVFIMWIGLNIAVLKRAKTSVDKPFMKQLWPESNKEFFTNDINDLKESQVLGILEEASGAADPHDTGSQNATSLNKFVIATAPLDATGKEELSFVPGEILEIIETEEYLEEGWKMGISSNGEEGLFPVAFTKPITPSEAFEKLRNKMKSLKKRKDENLLKVNEQIAQSKTKTDEEKGKFELLLKKNEPLSHEQKDELMSQLTLKTAEKDLAYDKLKQDEATLRAKLDAKETEFRKTKQQLKDESKALKTRITDEIKRYKLLQEEKNILSQEMKDMAHRLKVDDLCDVMLSTAYIQHQWEELGRVLRVPLSELKRIASKDRTTVTRSHYDTLRYWIVRVGGSWKGLIDALKHKNIRQKELADEIDRDHTKSSQRRQMVVVKNDKKITQFDDLLPYNIFSHVDWKVFGMVLGLDDDTLEQIDDTNTADDGKARLMVDKWISTGQPYWSILVNALDSPIIGETELANRIAKDEMGIDMQARGEDDGNLIEVKEKKEEILKKLTNAASTLETQPKGIIYAFAMTEVKGARVDLTTITNTFEKDLKFAVYPVEDITGAKLANLIKAAATVDYPLSCKHVCFYFAGHGGIRDKRPFFKPVAEKDGGDLFFIRENVLVHFGKKSRPKDKFIFFFDCCLTQSVDDKTPAEVGFLLEAPVRCLIAYATAVGVESYGDIERGGRWTSTLCEHLKEQVELGEALAKTHDTVMKLSDDGQPPQYRSCIGPVYLKGMPEKQASDEKIKEEESKNILRRHRSDLYETLHNDPIDLARLATALSMDGIIDHALEDEVIRSQGNKEVVGKFLDKLEEKADKLPMCLPRLFDKMAHFKGTLSGIAEVMKEEASNDKDAITTDLFEDLNHCKTENEVLKQRLEMLETRENKQQEQTLTSLEKNDDSKIRENVMAFLMSRLF